MVHSVSVNNTVPPRVAMVVVGAGQGLRFGREKPKQFQILEGLSVIAHSLRTALQHPSIALVQPVIGMGQQDLYWDAIGVPGDTSATLLPPTVGGQSRQASVAQGLEALADLPLPPDVVLVHDAARPWVSAALISLVIEAVDADTAAIPALPVTDTLKRGTGDPPLVETTVPRDHLWAVQTPQGFPFARLLAIHRAASADTATDDAGLAEAAGMPVRLVMGDSANKKITLARDLEAASTMTWETRTGFGVDAHRFTAGDHVTLCGVIIPHTQGLHGHSDADVAWHALADALYGALADGDIGSHFPPSDPQWRGAPSRTFVQHAASRVTARGGWIINVDVTIIGESPRIAPHRAAMTAETAAALGLDPSRVSIKATTTERMGFTGRQEGLAAQAVATIALPGGGLSGA